MIALIFTVIFYVLLIGYLLFLFIFIIIPGRSEFGKHHWMEWPLLLFAAYLFGGPLFLHEKLFQK